MLLVVGHHDSTSIQILSDYIIIVLSYVIPIRIGIMPSTHVFTYVIIIHYV